MGLFSIGGKQMITKRFKSIFIALLLVATLATFVACRRDNDGDDENGYNAIVFDENAPVAIMSGINIYAADIRPHLPHAEHMFGFEFWVMYNSMVIDFDAEYEGGLTFGDAIRQEAVRAAAFEIMLENYIVSLGITISTTQRQAIRADVDELLNMLGEQYAEILISQGFVDRYDLEEAFVLQYLVESMLEYVIGNPAEFAQFAHLLPEDHAEEQNAPSMAQINDILQRIHAGEDFDTLMHTYSQDPGLEWNPDGYTFLQGMMAMAFEQGTRNLEIGEISDVIITDMGARGNGAHIIKRVEPNMEEIADIYIEGEEVLAAKHILIMLPAHIISLDDRMKLAVSHGIYYWVMDTDIEFLPNLDGVSLQ